MIRVTLDTNCIIKALNPSEENHELVSRLIAMQELGKIELQVVAANASENARDIEKLRGELERLNLRNIPILTVPAILGLAYVGYAYVGGEEVDERIEEIWRILFPETPSDHAEFSRGRSATLIDGIHPDWRNRMCDVLTILAYIDDCKRSLHPGVVSVLVTTDSAIINRAQSLALLGAGNVCDIATAIETIDRLLASNSL